MHLWRVSRYLTLDGRGGLAASGRWHTRPKAVVYCSGDKETAIAEVGKQIMGRVVLSAEFHLLKSMMPDDFKLLKIRCDPSILVESVDANCLAPAWRSDIEGPHICRPIGDNWLLSHRTELLRVPSAVDPERSNYLFNPNTFSRDERVALELITSVL